MAIQNFTDVIETGPSVSRLSATTHGLFGVGLSAQFRWLPEASLAPSCPSPYHLLPAGVVKLVLKEHMEEPLQAQEFLQVHQLVVK